MVLGKLWKVYRLGIENWIVGLLQPVIDNLQKSHYVKRVEIRQFVLGEEPHSVRNVERRMSRRANDLHFNPNIQKIEGLSNWGEKGNWDEIRKQFDGMRNRGLKDSGVVYAVLVDIYDQYGHFRDAHELCNCSQG